MDKTLHSVISSCATGYDASIIAFASFEGWMSHRAGRREVQGQRWTSGNRGKSWSEVTYRIIYSANPSPREMQPRLMEAMK